MNMKLLISAFILIHPCFAFSGSIIQVVDSGLESENWRVEKPVVEIAVSFNQDQNIDRYITQIRDELKNSFQGKSLEIKVRYRARHFEVVQDLMNPSLVGYFLIGHTFQNADLGTSVFVDADQNSYPNELLSAATPALRFFVFLGCHGEGLLAQYQVKYELDHLPGKQSVYVSNQALLSTSKFFLLNGLKKDIRELGKQLASDIELEGGIEPTPSLPLLLKARDIVQGLEPRFAMVNQAIVGTLGTSPNDSNESAESKSFLLEVPKYRLKLNHCQLISVKSSNYGSGAFLDDYLLDGIQLGEKVDGKVFPIHLGDSPEIPSLKQWTPDEIKTQLSSSKLTVQKFLTDFFEQKEWLDRNQSNWPEPTALFYQACI